MTETRTAVREGVSNVLGLGVPILCIYDGDESPRCTSCYSTMLLKYPYQQSVVRVGVVGFTPVVNGGILSLKKDRTDSEFTCSEEKRLRPLAQVDEGVCGFF